ncbi:soluble lytic murein transglycosylase [Vibrio mediterranei AK1]|uniref:lytic transglycosylase domain-containing protein n=1 Tax=Vibrio mediterranei TaxID=689 RepID=UPI000154281F|nr:lytic transglycosylase domain-containing protein [Vibrio mediterranei]EDL52182.1 soluble lytic murein transglycosylase [Vibrio mediterranei AK1]
MQNAKYLLWPQVKWLLLISITIAPFSNMSWARDYSGWKSSQGWSKSAYYRLETNTLASCTKYCDLIKSASIKHGVPKNLIISVIRVESAFNPNAVSHKGAKGLMQLMDINSTNINPFNPNDNISRGTALLSRLMNKYNNLELALAAYNAGEGNVSKYGGIPPFKETQSYVKKVLKHYHALNKG